MKDTFRVEINYGACETTTSESGEVQIVWKRNPLGRVNEAIIKSIGFLYSNRDEAERGIGVGATAFMVLVPSEGVAAGLVDALPMGLCHAYIVTASHVVASKCTVLRIRGLDGKVNIVELPQKMRNSNPPKEKVAGANGAEEDAWIWHDEGNDVVVYPWPIFPNTKYNGVHIDSFATTASEWGDVYPKLSVEIGDEVFMPGRLLDLEIADPPVIVRFGKIAASGTFEISTSVPQVLPPQESYLAELRTDSGFSGAPVLITKPPLAPSVQNTVVTLKDQVCLLGINWGHLTHYEHILDMASKQRSTQLQTESNSGLAHIIPAWKIYQVLQYDELKIRRQEEWEDFKKQRGI